MIDITEHEKESILLALQSFLDKLRKDSTEAYIPSWQRELDKSIKEYEDIIDKMKEGQL